MKIYLNKIKKIFSNQSIQMIFFFSLLCLIFISQLGEIPNGLFCDEALIGYRAYELSQKKFTNFFNPFFYKHFGYAIGTLPVYASFPFVAIFGLSDFSIRLVSVFFSLLSLLIIFLILDLYSVRGKWFSVLLFALTPLFFHLSRVNIGHLSSLFFSLLGYYFLLLSKKRHQILLSACGGVLLGISFYGYSAYIISNLVFLLTIILGEFLLIKNKFTQYRYLVVFLLLAFLFFLPIISFGRSNPEFLKRFKEKGSPLLSLLSYKKIKSIAENYPKYYSYKYLFQKGEIDLPGAVITRHSVGGNGIFFKISALLLILSFLSFIFDLTDKKWSFIPFFLLFFLYPIPDAITTQKNFPPYSFAVFTTIFFLPFLTAYSLDFLENLFSSSKFKRWRLPFWVIVSFIFILEAINFFKNYQRYPVYSSGYWGWQYGPEEIISYFQEVKQNYDELYMTGYFNEPEIFLSFYDPAKLCKNCYVGGINSLNQNKKQLFAFRAVEIPDLMKLAKDLTFNPVHQVTLPDGRIEYLIGYFKPKNNL